VHGEQLSYILPQGIGGKESLMNGPMRVKVKSTKTPLYSLRY
jgi:hypothetical protein